MVDIVIPVYKPDEKFDRLIEALAMQSRKPDNLILMMTVSDEGSPEWQILENETRKLLNENGGTDIILEVHPVAQRDFYHGRTRNRGIAYGRNPYVLCMTQDAVPSDINMVERLMEILEMYPEVSQVYARQVTDNKAPDYITYTQNFNYPELRQFKNQSHYSNLGIKTIFCSNVCCMYRRDIFDFLGGFEDRVIFNEDMIYARKAVDAGYTIVYEGGVSVIHYHKYNLRQQFKRNFDLAVSQKMNKDSFAGLSSTKEGKKMVGNILKMLWNKRKYGTAFYYILLSSFKYLGYLCGKHYEIFPYSLKVKLSSNPSFWKEG